MDDERGFMVSEHWTYQECDKRSWAICASFEHVRGTSKHDAFAYTVYSEDIPATCHCLDIEFAPFSHVDDEVARLKEEIETFKEVTKNDEVQLREWLADIRAERK